MLSNELRIHTLRRYYLDNCLTKCNFYGKILDIGGKKTNKKGLFQPPTKKVESWEYVNIDKSTNPDYLCPADANNVQDMSFDIVILTEVLEHLETPEKVLQEIHRVLKQQGKMILSMLFYTRYTGIQMTSKDGHQAKSNKFLDKISFLLIL